MTLAAVRAVRRRAGRRTAAAGRAARKGATTTSRGGRSSAPARVTHEKRDPWERPGGTTFHFVNDGIEDALDQAREAAGDRDVRIAGGGATILEYLNDSLIDEFSITLSPVLFGSGIRLFDMPPAGPRIHGRQGRS
jgi:dihydrofolate reductase